MAAGTLSEVLVRGSTHRFRVSVLNEIDLTPVNISGWTQFWCTAKETPLDADPGVFQLTLSGGGIAILNASQGLIEVTIPDTTFTTPGVSAHYYLDVKGKDDAGRRWTLAIGRLTVQADETRAS